MNFSDFYLDRAAWQSSGIRTVLFDVDGTLASGPHPVPGADALLQHFRDERVPFLLLTNDSHHSPVQKCALLARAGIHALPEEVVSCSHALAGFVKLNHLVGKRAFIMGEFGDPCYAEAAGLMTTRDAAMLDDCDMVITGEGHYDWHRDVTAAANFFLHHPERLLVCSNPDVYWPNARTGRIGIGAGAVARFVLNILEEMHVKIKSVFLGKPYPGIYLAAMHRAAERFALAELKPGEVLMIGDSLTSDVAGAKALGIWSALVMTGITTPEILAAASPAERPDYVFESVSGGKPDFSGK